MGQFVSLLSPTLFLFVAAQVLVPLNTAKLSYMLSLHHGSLGMNFKIAYL